VSVPAKMRDSALLVLSIIAIMPLVVLAFFVLVIGYPLHLIKEFLFSNPRKK